MQLCPDRKSVLRRLPGKSAIILLSLTLLAGAVTGCSFGRKKPWNIILISIDTLRADHIGAYGGPVARTPVIDRLAGEGTIFTDAYCSIPITLPSHTSILTGQYPRTHQVLSHGFTLADERVSIAEVLKENGYRTAAFISSHVLDNKYGISQGFEFYWERYNYDMKRVKNLLMTTGEDLLTTTAVDWIRTGQKEPFFLWVHWFHPHKPYDPPPPMRLAYDPDPENLLAADVPTLKRVWKGELEPTEEDIDRFRMLYAGEVAYVDRQVGILLDRMESMGILDHTIVILTADHGEVLYEHDRYFGHDIMLYDPSLRVPLIMTVPDLANRAKISDATVRNIDLMPTLLDILDIPADPYGLEGRSFLAALRGETLKDVPVFAEVYPPKEEWKSLPRHAVQYGGWKLITIDGTDGKQLYQLDVDPQEIENLAEKETEQLALMERMLYDWMQSDSGSDIDYPVLSEEERNNLRNLGYIGD